MQCSTRCISVSGSVVSAQSVALAAVVERASHKLLPSALVGAAARVRLPIGDSPFSWRAGIDRETASTDGTERTCNRFPLCDAEPVRKHARLIAIEGGVEESYRFSRFLVGAAVPARLSSWRSRRD